MKIYNIQNEIVKNPQSTLDVVECYADRKEKHQEMNQIISHILKMRRHDLNITLKECHVDGVSTSYLNKAENNKIEVSREVIAKLCNRFNIPLEKLMSFAQNVSLERIMTLFIAEDIQGLKELRENDLYSELNGFNMCALEALVSVYEKRLNDTNNYLNSFAYLRKTLDSTEWFVFFYVKAWYDYYLNNIAELKEEIIILDRLTGNSPVFKMAYYILTSLATFMYKDYKSTIYFYNQIQWANVAGVSRDTLDIINLNYTYLINVDRNEDLLEEILLTPFEKNGAAYTYAIALLVRHYFDEANYSKVYDLIKDHHLERDAYFKGVIVFLGYKGNLRALPLSRLLVKDSHLNEDFNLEELYYVFMDSILNLNMDPTDVLNKYDDAITKSLALYHHPYINELFLAAIYKIYRNSTQYKRCLDILLETFKKGYSLNNFSK